MPRDPAPISPRGGPQPAKANRKARTRTFANVAEKGLKVAATQAQGKREQLAQPGADWRPSGGDLAAYLAAVNPPRRGDDGMKLPPWQQDELAPIGNTSRSNIEFLDSLVRSSETPRDLLGNLQDQLGIKLEGRDFQRKLIDPILDTAEAVAAADRQARDERKLIEEAYAETPSAQAAQTQNQTDPNDPYGLLAAGREQPFSAAEMENLLLDMETARVEELPARLDAAKGQILQTAAAHQERTRQLEAAYLAGAQGAPLPETPAPGESTEQGSYVTAGDPTYASVLPDEVGFGVDVTDADEAILQAATLVERKRRAESERRVAIEFERQARARLDQEEEIRAVEEKALNDQETTRRKAEEEAQRKAYELEARQNLILDEKDKLLEDPDLDMDSETARSVAELIRAGASDGTIAQQVFDVYELSELTAAQLRWLMLSRAEVTGKIPDVLSQDYELYLEDTVASYE